MSDEKILEIIKHYGVSHQQRKLAEEMFELQEAIIEAENYKPKENDSYRKTMCNINYYVNHIAEEIADVCVLLLQFKEHYHIDGNDILRIMDEKIERTLERMEK